MSATQLEAAPPLGPAPSLLVPRIRRVVPARRPLRGAGSVCAGVLLALIAYSTFTNPRWGWGVFAQWFFATPVLVGFGRTLLLTALGTVGGFVLGTLLALAQPCCTD